MRKTYNLLFLNVEKFEYTIPPKIRVSNFFAPNIEEANDREGGRFSISGERFVKYTLMILIKFKNSQS